MKNNDTVRNMKQNSQPHTKKKKKFKLKQSQKEIQGQKICCEFVYGNVNTVHRNIDEFTYFVNKIKFSFEANVFNLNFH